MVNVFLLKRLKKWLKKKPRRSDFEGRGFVPSPIIMKIKAPTEVVPVTESESSIKDEVSRRTFQAGYTDRDGQPKISRNNGAGKGDVPRSCNMGKYRKNYEKAFGHS